MEFIKLKQQDHLSLPAIEQNSKILHDLFNVLVRNEVSKETYKAVYANIMCAVNQIEASREMYEVLLTDAGFSLLAVDSNSE